MKRIVIIAAMALIGATSASAYDWSSRTSFTSEWQQQSARITAGRKSGVLSRAEARMLRRELDALGDMPYNSATRVMLSRHSKRIAAYKSPTGE
jgi:hypothetical protein